MPNDVPSQRWCEPQDRPVRTWFVYGPREHETQALCERPCVLVMVATERQLVRFIGIERSYSWEWTASP